MKKVLIIEDDTDLLEEIGEILTYEGYFVVLAGDGKDGLEKAWSERPHIILSDIKMPEIDGFEVFKSLYLTGDYITVPFIFISGLTDRQTYRHGMELGADDFLFKPFTRQELLRAVEIRLKQSRQIESEIERRIKMVEKNLARRLEKIMEGKKSDGPQAILPYDGLRKKVNHFINMEIQTSIQANNVIKELKDAIQKELKQSLSPAQKKMLQRLEERINSPGLIRDNQTAFLLQVESRFPHFLERVRQKHPLLTRYDRIFIAASYLELDTFQMADLLVISAESVRKSRYRIKKKLGLKKEDDFQVYIKGFDS